MKWFLLAMLLASQAVSPIPRKTSNDATRGTSDVTKQSKENESQATLAPVQNKETSASTQGNGKNEASEDKQAHVIVDSLPEKDPWDKFYIGLTFALVLIGGGTLGAIWYQAKKTAESAASVEKSVRLQEVAMRQWVNVDGLEVATEPRFQSGAAETRLVFTFNILNPTKLPLTLEWVVVRVNGERQSFSFHHFLPPDDLYPVKTFTVIKGKQTQDYGNYNLASSFIATVGYTDVFETRRRQPFGVMCLLGPPKGCKTSPYEWPLPDDDIQKSDDKSPN